MSPCAGCGAGIPDGAEVSVWLDTPLGICCSKAHAGCEEAARAAQREQPARIRSEPKVREVVLRARK